MKSFGAVGIGIAAGLLLSACAPSAQNLGPAGDQNDAEDSRTNPAQANKNACDLASDSTLAALTDLSSSGPARVGWVAEGDGGWYVSAPLGEDGTLSDVVGLWATDKDPADKSFDSTLYAVNGDAQSNSTAAKAAATTFTAESSAAKKAITCATETDD
ncbi:hypothetical protein [Frondihabitans sp. Leaf304]|uniref:hypothetical protein n=1 Tax=Frondihabitans sp. Leaf304 TaxID=1736329 RepID=UPI0006F64B66|nr:hypothetical protein [Frondihabitans sp. Leaf304]KQQ28715.1 hypothetical protein ASF54_08740 [Frondihabitans sp. Leaf304]